MQRAQCIALQPRARAFVCSLGLRVTFVARRFGVGTVGGSIRFANTSIGSISMGRASNASSNVGVGDFVRPYAQMGIGT